jgi:DNA-binding MarR family transcriptional regulator
MDIMRVMWRQAPMNQRQIAAAVRDLPQHGTISDRAIQPRVVTMERMGLVELVESKPDPQTGRRSAFYQLTYRRPIMTLAEASQMGSRRNLRALERENKELRDLVAKLNAELTAARNVGQMSLFD